MSRETLKWLNENTLVGFTETDGNAWHWDGISQNQYPGPIPVDDIRMKLFNWKAEFRTPYFHLDESPDTPFDGPDDFEWGRMSHDAETKAVVRITPEGDIIPFNYVSGIYAIHQFDEWLIDNVMQLVDASEGELEFGSAVLLKNGAVAAVQIRRPETITIGGDELLPYILAVTSHDSTIATTYKPCYGRVVCDNTLDLAINEKLSSFRVKHTKGSRLLIAQARETLGLMFAGMDEFNNEVAEMMATPLSPNQVAGAIRHAWPQPDPKVDEEGNVTNARSINNWDRRFDELWHLWNTDERVGEYKGTMWGGLMAHNTWSQWGMAERDTNDRDTSDVKHSQLVGSITGDIATDDRKFIRAMEMALA